MRPGRAGRESHNPPSEADSAKKARIPPLRTLCSFSGNLYPGTPRCAYLGTRVPAIFISLLSNSVTFSVTEFCIVSGRQIRLSLYPGGISKEVDVVKLVLLRASSRTTTSTMIKVTMMTSNVLV
eukprot:441309-Rhodomonas_salina.4